MFQKSKKKSALVQANLLTLEEKKYQVEREELSRVKSLAVLNGDVLLNGVNPQFTDRTNHANALDLVKETQLSEFAKDLGHVTRVTEELGEHFFNKFHFKKKK